MAIDWTEDVLADDDDPWRCDYCGDSYQFATHPGCLKKALKERDEARAEAERLNVLLREEIQRYRNMELIALANSLETRLLEHP